jgi:hypothetical protein
LSKWIKPVVHGRKEKIDYLALIIQNATSTIENAGFQRISDKNIRYLAKGMPHANVNHKASFAGMTGKVSCVKVARHILPKKSIDELDESKLDLHTHFICSFVFFMTQNYLASYHCCRQISMVNPSS